jgi:hypothetical protein
MTSLHIQHPITDLPTWVAAYSAFAEKRRMAGVVSETVRHPVGDERYIVIDLDFETVDQAAAFRHFLETSVWGNTQNSPALGGTPEVRILERVELGAPR